MLPEPIKRSIRDALHQVGESAVNFKSRSSQRLMIAEIAKTLTRTSAEGKKIIAIEGPTGTGKTLAYLLACIPVVQSQQKRLVISSATVALQNQLIEKDIPQMMQHSGLDFSFEIAKGRGRYFCPKLAEQHIEEMGQMDALNDNDDVHVLLRSLFDAFDSAQWGGDKDSWETDVSTDVWAAVSNDRHRCIAKYCEYFQRCPYFCARHKLGEADVIVANHDLVLADMALGGGVVLPKPEDTVYVFDEAHHLPAKAVEHVGAWCGIESSIGWLEGLPALVKRALSLLSPLNTIETDIQKIRDAATGLAKELNQIKVYLASFPAFTAGNNGGQETVHRFAHGEIPTELVDMGRNIKSIAMTLSHYLRSLKQALLKCLEEQTVNGATAEALLPDVSVALDKVATLQRLWQMFIHNDADSDSGALPIAKWVTQVFVQGKAELCVNSTPVSAAKILEEQLWEVCHGAVLTSATLTVAKDFSRFQGKAGLADHLGVNYVVLDSPFDYANSATLYVPRLSAEPSQSEQHTQQVIDALPKLLASHMGALVLFSARAQMQKVAKNLSGDFAHDILMQGNLPTQHLIQQHQQNINEKRPSVIFGLTSFSEGIDLPGDYCTHVVIVRLPFTVPDTPIAATEREYVESQSGNFFYDVALPDACFRLKQAVGRLLRCETDVGQVTILDKRIVSKAYGKRLLSALPPMRLVVENVKG